MRAALLHEFGKPLSIEEVARPLPAAGEVLLEVEACGVCHSDLHIALGDWPNFAKLIHWPLILGHEVVGRVVEVGEGVDANFAAPALACRGFIGRAASVSVAAKAARIFASRA